MYFEKINNPRNNKAADVCGFIFDYAKNWFAEKAFTTKNTEIAKIFHVFFALFVPFVVQLPF